MFINFTNSLASFCLPSRWRETEPICAQPEEVPAERTQIHQLGNSRKVPEDAKYKSNFLAANPMISRYKFNDLTKGWSPIETSKSYKAEKEILLRVEDVFLRISHSEDKLCFVQRIDPITSQVCSERLHLIEEPACILASQNWSKNLSTTGEILLMRDQNGICITNLSGQKIWIAENSVSLNKVYEPRQGNLLTTFQPHESLDNDSGFLAVPDLPVNGTLLLPYNKTLRSVVEEILCKHPDWDASFAILTSKDEDTHSLEALIQRLGKTKHISLLKQDAAVHHWLRDVMTISTRQGELAVFTRPGESKKHILDLDVIFKKFGGNVRESPFVVRDGDILVGENYILISEYSVKDNLRAGCEYSESNFIRDLQKVYGNMPVHILKNELGIHLDLFITILPGQKILLADPSWGLELLEEQPENVIKDFFNSYMALSRPDDIRRFGHEEIFVKPGIKIGIEETRRVTAKISPKLDVLATELSESGFLVTRIPLVAGYEESDNFMQLPKDTSYYPLATYNNGVTLGEFFLLPQYGISLDAVARDILEGLGYPSTPITNCRELLELKGVLRCISKFLPLTFGKNP